MPSIGFSKSEALPRQDSTAESCMFEDAEEDDAPSEVSSDPTAQVGHTDGGDSQNISGGVEPSAENTQSQKEKRSVGEHASLPGQPTVPKEVPKIEDVASIPTEPPSQLVEKNQLFSPMSPTPGCFMTASANEENACFQSTPRSEDQSGRGVESMFDSLENLAEGVYPRRNHTQGQQVAVPLKPATIERMKSFVMKINVWARETLFPLAGDLVSKGVALFISATTIFIQKTRLVIQFSAEIFEKVRRKGIALPPIDNEKVKTQATQESSGTMHSEIPKSSGGIEGTSGVVSEVEITSPSLHHETSLQKQEIETDISDVNTTDEKPPDLQVKESLGSCIQENVELTPTQGPSMFDFIAKAVSKVQATETDVEALPPPETEGAVSTHTDSRSPVSSRTSGDELINDFDNKSVHLENKELEIIISPLGKEKSPFGTKREETSVQAKDNSSPSSVHSATSSEMYTPVEQMAHMSDSSRKKSLARETAARSMNEVKAVKDSLLRALGRNKAEPETKFVSSTPARKSMAVIADVLVKEYGCMVAVRKGASFKLRCEKIVSPGQVLRTRLTFHTIDKHSCTVIICRSREDDLKVPTADYVNFVTNIQRSFLNAMSNGL